MENTVYKVGIYCRLSKDDPQEGDSSSIVTQKAILLDYCAAQNYEVCKVYVDDGYSGLNFNRPGFQELLADVENGTINLVLTKDLSRLGRDYIMTGYYSEIYFASKGARYIALADDFDSLKENNDLAPFKNILNDLYARDISNKIKNAKHQRAKQGLFVGSQTPYGYCLRNDDRRCLFIDPEPAETVKTIFALALQGLGDCKIAQELENRRILAPSAYKFRAGDTRFKNYTANIDANPYIWAPATIGTILTNRVYLGELTSLKTEVVNCKTKRRVAVPPENRIVTPNAHEAIISETVFNEVQQIRSTHRCAANYHRENIFRGLLFCNCCGHPLAISRKQLKYRVTDIYLCMHHYNRPDQCPKTHCIYHEMLYPYVLQQIQLFAKSMKRRKVNAALSQYADIQELTPEILNAVIERIEIGHVSYKTKPGSAIQIYWKLT